MIPLILIFLSIFAAKNITFSQQLRVSQDALDAGGCAAGDQRLPFGDLRLQTRHGGRNSGAGRRWQTAADFLRSQVNKKLGVSENSVSLNPMVNDHYPY